MEQIYINKKIQYWIDRLIDLFCLEDNIPTVFLRPNKDNMSATCTFAVPKLNSQIVIGCKGGLRLSTLVHEFIHAMGYKHTFEINGFADFASCHDDKEWRYRNGQRRTTDTYSTLIVQDLTGKKELIL